MSGRLVFCFAMLYVCLVSSEDTLRSRLRHYETLQKEDVVTHHVQRRSVHNVLSNLHNVPVASERKVSFSVLGRHFTLSLHRRRSLLSASFQARRVAGGKRRSDEVFPLSENEFYAGTVQGEPGSSVTAYWDDGHLVATIRTKDDVISIEPAWRHLGKSGKFDMIAYRASDLKGMSEKDGGVEPGTKICGYANPEEDSDYEPPVQSPERKRRGKRQSTVKNTCTVALVADYKFFTEVGGGDEYATAKYMIGTVSRVNDLYRVTNFDGEEGGAYVNLGFEINEVIINTSPTPDVTDHYNMQRDVWPTKDLLKAFSNNPAWADVCLAHLFTATAFSDGVLGLAWVASASENSAGGICSPPGGVYYYNTGWTTALSKAGDRLLTQETDLVTAHEFGHNWGSQHDPDTDECAPGQLDGGNYLMYTYSVSGYESNNNKFSPCSKRAILSVLQNKAANCFTEPSQTFCGNFNVEEGEECDVGGRGDDPCCDTSCKLMEGALCSDQNSPCCQNCTVARVTKQCSGGGSLTSCTSDAFCDGIAITCPQPGNKPDGTPCIDGGTCQSGECLSYCETRGLESCKCDTVELSCQTCCKSAVNGSACEVYKMADGSTLPLSDGKTCVQGTCETGECIKEIRNLSGRLWQVLDNFDTNLLVKFMKNNIVLTTIVCSLVVYIPFCICVYCIDKRNEDEDDEEVRWRNKDNEELLHSSDDRLIMQSYSRRRGKKSAKSRDKHSARRGQEYVTEGSFSGQSTTSASKVKVHPI